jgi:Fe-S-cluster containining protein
VEEDRITPAGICGACGLCCDGSFFGHVEVTHEEAPALRRHALPLFEQGPGVAFAQPCAAHRGDHCGVYADRPRPCVDYRCTLLRRVDDGEVSRADALARIAKARSLIAGLYTLAGPTPAERAAPRNLWAAVEARIASGGALAETLAWRRTHQILLLELATVTTFLRKHFQPSLRQAAAPGGVAGSAAPPAPSTPAP